MVLLFFYGSVNVYIMGLSRRIKFKYKFVQKYKTNVYQLFTKKNFVRDLFVFKFFSRLFRFEAYALERKLEKLTVVERARKYRTRQNVAVVCFRVQIKYLLVLWQLVLVFGLSQKSFSKLIGNFRLFLNNNAFAFTKILLQQFLYTKTRVLCFFYLFWIVRGFLKFFKCDFVHTKVFLREIFRLLKRKNSFGLSFRVLNRNKHVQSPSRFGFSVKAFSKNRRFIYKNKSKKKKFYFRKLKKYLHRFDFFKKLFVTFFDKPATKKSRPFNKKGRVFSVVKLAKIKTSKLKLKTKVLHKKFLQKNVHFNQVKNFAWLNNKKRSFSLSNKKYKHTFSSYYKHKRKFSQDHKYKRNSRFYQKYKSKFSPYNKYKKYAEKKPRFNVLAKVYSFKQNNFHVKVKKIKKKHNYRLRLRKLNVWKNCSFRKRNLFRVFFCYSGLKVLNRVKVFKKRIKIKNIYRKCFFDLKKSYTKHFQRFSMSGLFFPNTVLVKRNPKLKLTFFVWQKLLPFFSTKQTKRVFFDIKNPLYKVFFNLPIFSKINLVKPLRKFYLLEEPLIKFYKVSTFFSLRNQKWMESYFRFSSLYKNSFQILHRRFNGKLFVLESRLLAGFICKILKFLVFCPFVKAHSKVFQNRRFWKMLGCLLTKKIKDLVFVNLKVTNPKITSFKQDRFFTDSFYTTKFKLPLKIFEFFNQKTSFLFGRFFSRLVKRYGGKRDFLSKIPFRLDIPFQKRKLKKKTEKHERFQHLKIIRRHYGNLTRKQMSKYRKISFVKNKGSAFFNSILLLESRIDFFATKCNFFNPIFDTRNFVFHGFLIVNGKQQTNINFRVDFGDVVSVITSFIYKYRFYFTSKFIHNLYGEGGHVLLSKIFPKYLVLTSRAIKCCYLPWVFAISLITENFFIEKVLSENNGRFYYVTI